MDESSEVTTIVEDHVQRLAAGEGSKGLFDAPLVLLFGLTLPGKNGDAGSSDAGKVILEISVMILDRLNDLVRSRGVVLSREDVL